MIVHTTCVHCILGHSYMCIIRVNMYGFVWAFSFREGYKATKQIKVVPFDQIVVGDNLSCISFNSLKSTYMKLSSTTNLFYKFVDDKIVLSLKLFYIQIVEWQFAWRCHIPKSKRRPVSNILLKLDFIQLV